MALVKPVEIKLDLQAFRKKQLKGFKRIGYGAFAHVHAKNAKAESVFKTGYEADGYMHFVKQVGIENPCIHVPTIYDVQRFYRVVKDKDWNGKPVVHKSFFYMVEMERLVKYNNMNDKERRAAFKRAGIEDIYDIARPGTWKNTSPHTKSFKQIMQKTFKGHGHNIDLHDGNVMFRHRIDGKHDVYDLVVTDPLC